MMHLFIIPIMTISVCSLRHLVNHCEIQEADPAGHYYVLNACEKKAQVTAIRFQVQLPIAIKNWKIMKLMIFKGIKMKGHIGIY